MTLTTYLTFEDKCREAFDYYRSVFGGEFRDIQAFRDGPGNMKVPEAELDRIMHVSLPIGSSILMGSDSCSAFGPAAGGRRQLRNLLRGGEQGTGRRGIRKAVRRRRGEDADGRGVLGRLLRGVCRQVRHQLAGHRRPLAGPQSTGGGRCSRR